MGGGSARRKPATYTGKQKHRINAGKYPCLEWDSNLRPQCSSGQKTFHASERAATVIGLYLINKDKNIKISL
jgi:hypothetical protein